MRVVPSGPDCPTDTIYDVLLTAAFRAERRFWVATPYFVPDEGLARALEVAARRGVDVRVVVPNRSNHMRSLFLDYEVALFPNGAAELTRLSAWFEATMARSEIGLVPPGRVRLEAEKLCRLLAPLI